MDGEDFTADEYATTLRELELLNRLTNGYGPTIAAVRRLMKGASGAVRVLDIGCGHGDTLRALARVAQREGWRAEFIGVDLNHQAVALARDASHGISNLRFEAGDIFHRADLEADIIINALFMHHLEDEQIARLLNWMNARASRGWFINDLHRHWFAYHFIRHATGLTGFNRLIRHDAPLSVARGFVREDWERYCARAEIPPSAIEVRWHMPFRYGVFCDTIAMRTQGGDE